MDVNKSTVANWGDFIAETDHVLNTSTGGEYFFTEYMVDVISKVYQYDYQGKKGREIALPGVGSVSSLSGKKDETTLYYAFTNYKTPSTIYSFDVSNAKTDVYRQ